MVRFILFAAFCVFSFASMADDNVVYSEAWLKADAAEKSERTSEPELVVADRTKKLPYRVFWPNGRKSQLAVREFYKDGSHTDWFVPNGRGRHYDAEGTFVKHINGYCGCRNSPNIKTSSNSFKIWPN